MAKIILITGATSGFGEAIALKFAENGFNVIITGRRKERLDVLKGKIENSFDAQVIALDFDVREKDAVSKAISSIPENFRNIDILVNNAGLAVGRNTIDQ